MLEKMQFNLSFSSEDLFKHKAFVFQTGAFDLRHLIRRVLNISPKSSTSRHFERRENPGNEKFKTAWLLSQPLREFPNPLTLRG